MCHFSKDEDVSISVLQEDPVLFEMIMNGREKAIHEIFARETLPKIKYLEPEDPIKYLTQETNDTSLHDIIYFDLVYVASLSLSFFFSYRPIDRMPNPHSLFHRPSKKKNKEHSYQDRVDNVLRSYHGPFDEERVTEILWEALYSTQYGVICKTRKDREPLLPDRLNRSFVEKDMRYDVYESKWTELALEMGSSHAVKEHSRV